MVFFFTIDRNYVRTLYKIIKLAELEQAFHIKLKQKKGPLKSFQDP